MTLEDFYNRARAIAFSNDFPEYKEDDLVNLCEQFENERTDSELINLCTQILSEQEGSET